MAVERFARSAVAFLLEMRLYYPCRRMVFLARDMEYHHIVHEWMRVRGLFDSKPSILLHVGRSSMGHSDLRIYLEDVLGQPGAELLLIDTGFYGTVIERIEELLPEVQMRSHLVCSLDGGLPESQYALHFLGADPGNDLLTRRSVVKAQIEHLPHRLKKVSQYRQVRGRMRPVLMRGEPGQAASAQQFEAALMAVLDKGEFADWLAGEKANFATLADAIDLSPPRRVSLQLTEEEYACLAAQGAPRSARHLLGLLQLMEARGALAIEVGPLEQTPLDDGAGANNASDRITFRALAPAGTSFDEQCISAIAELHRMDAKEIRPSAIAALRSTATGRALMIDCLQAHSRGLVERPVHETRMRQLWNMSLASAGGGELFSLVAI